MSENKGILAFLAITFGVAYAVEIWMMQKGISLSEPPSSVAPQLTLAGVMFVPGVAAFIVRKFITKEAFYDAGLKIGDKRYYLIAWLLPVGLSLAVVLLTAFLEQGKLDLSMSKLMQSLKEEAPEGKSLPSPGVLFAGLFFSALTFGVIINSLFTFGEEFGWRGYLLMRLLPLGRVQAMSLTGFIWGLWHAPLILMGYNYGKADLLSLLFMIIFCILGSIIFGWLRLASRSVLVPTVAHASTNGPAMTLTLLIKDYSVFVGTLFGVIGFLVMGAFIIWLYLTGNLNKGEV